MIDHCVAWSMKTLKSHMNPDCRWFMKLFSVSLICWINVCCNGGLKVENSLGFLHLTHPVLPRRNLANLGCMANMSSPNFPLPISPAIVAFGFYSPSSLQASLGGRSPEQGISAAVSLSAGEKAVLITPRRPEYAASLIDCERASYMHKNRAGYIKHLPFKLRSS